MKTSPWQRMAAFLSALMLAGPLTIVVSISELATSVFAATVPPDFTDALVASGLTWPTGLAVANDGRIFVTEQSGPLRVIKNGALLPTPFIQLTVRGQGERRTKRGSSALRSIRASPPTTFSTSTTRFPRSGNIPSHNRVSRFTANGDVVVPGQRESPPGCARPIVRGSQRWSAFTSAPTASCTSQWEITASSGNGQSMNTIKGKLLRINADGTIPQDNPFFATATGQNRAIWALGLRNPYRFGVQPGTGKILINDVGNGTFEEINLGVAGANYGWNLTEGPTNDPAVLALAALRVSPPRLRRPRSPAAQS